MSAARDVRPAAREHSPRAPGALRSGIRAVIIESADETCSVVGYGPAISCSSLEQAMDLVEASGPQLRWRELTPGFWVARLVEPGWQALAG